MATACTKPVKRKVRANVPFGVNPDIILTIYPSGVIGLRESRRRREYIVSIGMIYQNAVLQCARAEAIERKKARKLKRKGL